jgi:short-subunit dehydrogenase
MNKLIVVTGGTKGIGRAIVEKFASAGFDIVTCARNLKDLESLHSEVQKLNPAAQVITYQADLGKPEQVATFCRQVIALGRPVDILVNNTGYFVPGELCTEPEGTLEKMMQANVYSAYHTTRAIVPVMKESKSGHVFNMCSIASIKAYPNGGSYAITKFALLGFSKCLREELKPFGIRVTSVMPGATLTASWEGVNLPEDRFIKPSDVAETVYAAWHLSARSVVEEIVIRPQLGDI